MTAASEFDVGPLTWVKGEIDAALDRAEQALGQYESAEGGDLTQIKFARTHLHQVQGALTIVGLDGVTQFIEAVEGELDDLEQAKRPADASALALVRRAFQAIRRYLDDLLNGEPNQPLRLLDLYEEVQRARGVESAGGADLFYPDLSVRPPRRSAPVTPLAPAALTKHLKKQRALFQRGLLAWLRGDRAGLDTMGQALAAIESSQEDVPSARAFWWASQGFLAALAAGSLAAGTDVKSLCARIDLQIRRLIEGSRNFAERLLRDVLYKVAQSDGADPAVAAVQQSYGLNALLPARQAGGLPPERPPQDGLLRRLREVVVSAEEAWGKFCAGSASALGTFKDQTAALAQGCGGLQQPDLAHLTEALAQAAAWVAAQPSRHSEALAMEMATAILLVSQALENFHRLGADFPHQVEVMTARLSACLAGTPPAAGAEVPALDEMSRQAQEKLLNSQVAKEIQSNLVQIEQVLDSFFRDPSRRDDLAGAQALLKQAVGALSMLGQEAAASALRDCAAQVDRFAQGDYQPTEQDFEGVADQLSALGFFVEALPRELAKGTADFTAFTHHLGPQTDTQEAEPLPEAAAPVPSVEQELVKQKRETQNLLSALKEQPADPSLRQELKENLESLQKGADLVADKTLGEQAKAALSALEATPPAHGEAVPHLEAAVATLQGPSAAAPAPSAETLALSQASGEELDAELLSIFLEEAQEVLATIGEHIGLLHQQPQNADFLTNIRRGFHTLKGSGRMVGLKDLGETAWAIEQVLNLWLRQEYPVSDQLFGLIEKAHALFGDWVHYLESHQGTVPDPSALIGEADRMRLAETPAAPAVEEPEAVPAPVVPPEETSPSLEETVINFGLPPLDDGEESPAEPALDSPLPDLDFSAPEIAAPAAPAAPVAPAPEEAPAKPKLTLTISATLYQIFLDEARGHLVTLQQQFGELETAPAMPTPEPMARAAHTLAGIAATVGLTAINELSHALEKALLRRQQAAQPASLEALETVRLSISSLEDMVAAVAEQQPPVAEPLLIDALESLYPAPIPGELNVPQEDIPAVIPGLPEPSGDAQDELDDQLLPIFLEEAQDLVQNINTQLEAWRERPDDGDVGHALGRLLHTLKGSARMAGAMALGDLTHALESRVEQAYKSGAVTPEAIDDVQADFDVIAQIVDRLQQGERPDVPAVVPVQADAPGAPAAPAPEPEPEVPASAEELSLAEGPEVPVTGAPVPETEAIDLPEPPALSEEAPEPQVSLEELAAEEGTEELPAEEISLPELPDSGDEGAWDESPAPALATPDEAAPATADLGPAEAAELPALASETAPADSLAEVEDAAPAAEAPAPELPPPSIPAEDEVSPEALAVPPAPAAEEMDVALEAPAETQVEGPLEAEGALAAPADAAPEPASAPEAAPSPAPEPLPGVVDVRPVAPGVVPAMPDLEAETAALKANLRVRADLVDRLVNEAGEISIARSRIEGEMRSLKDSLLDLTENVIRLRRQVREVEIQAETQIQARQAQATEHQADFDPLELDRFTHFQELTRMMAESVNDVATVQQNLLKNLDEANAAIVAQARLNRELQQELMSVRMVPFASQAERLQRLVRQTARELGKKVSLDIQGGQVELDRGVLDKMVAPLEHMLRNAVAHGVEGPETRTELGKPEAGAVLLKAAQQGNEIILTLSDDGSGLDLEKIRAKAETMGLLNPGETVDNARLADFIFTPGFSTAGVVTQVAGRGVGMDVVRTEVSNLGGRVELQSEAGKGLTFRIYLPLTLAITQALIVRVGSQRYAVPSALIEQVQEISASSLETVRQAKEAVWMGNHYPYYFLPHLLGDKGAQPEPRRLSWVLYLRSGSQRTAVQVDELDGNQEIVVKNVGPQLARVVGIAGATVLGDGQVLLILNPVALAVSRATATPAPALTPAVSGGTAAPVPATPGGEGESGTATLPTVMVVDDSLTVRKITSRLLTREGFHVVTAKDGVDALEKMIDTLPDVLLVDIEMPRMDGFDLTRNVRADERLKAIPIIMITSRTADKHRNYAFEIGVNNYLGKPYREDELLELVRGYTGVKPV